ncbi:MAG: Zn-dependent exopeptidase M28 [Tissierellaceae bacterium]|nr:Zn-dependent exopeptidase M28 [Tissierellaceae bacterium]
MIKREKMVRKNIKKIILLSAALLLLMGCAKETLKPDFSTVKSTLYALEDIEYRGINAKGNYEFTDNLKKYLRSLESDNLKMYTQEFTVKMGENPKLIISDEDSGISFDMDNAKFTSLNTEKMKIHNAVVTDDLNEIKNNKEEDYIYLIRDIKNLGKSQYYANIVATIVLGGAENDGIPPLVKEDAMRLRVDEQSFKKAEKFSNKSVEISLEADIKDVKLENVYMIYGKNENKDALVLSAHFDSIGKSEGKYSKGILDNGSGVAVVLDSLHRTIDEKINTDKDIVFAFLNAEEEGLSGSKEFSTLMNLKYNNVIDINFDCIGEKGTDTVYYGMSNSISEDLIKKNMNNIFGDKYSLKEDNQYLSDHVNFTNYIYIYNMDYEKTLYPNTSKDNADAVDMDKLEDISNMSFDFIKQIARTKTDKLLNGNVQTSVNKMTTYMNSLDFGEYVFYELSNEHPEQINFYVQNQYRTTVSSLSDLDESFCGSMEIEDGTYNLNMDFDLPGKPYRGETLDKAINYFRRKPTFKELYDKFPIGGFGILCYKNNDPSDIQYSFYINKYDSETKKAIGDYYEKDFENMTNLVKKKDGERNIYIGEEQNGNENIKVINTTFSKGEYYYVCKLRLFDSELSKLSDDELINLNSRYVDDACRVTDRTVLVDWYTETEDCYYVGCIISKVYYKYEDRYRNSDSENDVNIRVELVNTMHSIKH